MTDRSHTERISEAELAVMDVLWAESPLTAMDVATRIDPARGWSDRTVKTLLGRLLAKGILDHVEDGRRYLYRPLVARDAYVTSESRRLVDRLFGGRAAPLVAHLAETQALTAQDIAELEALVRELKA
jgi:predicted transcriptional regulator